MPRDRRLGFKWLILAPVVIVSTQLNGCGLNDPAQGLPYPWVQIGAVFEYDFEPGDPEAYSELPEHHRLPRTQGALRMEIVSQTGWRPRLRWSYPEWPSIPGAIGATFMTDDMNVTRRPDGLYDSAPGDCGWGSLFSFDFLRAPAIPSVGQKFPDYWCKDRYWRWFEITAIGTQIVVPAGEFDTFVIEDDIGRGREFWDPSHGIVRIDRLDDQGRLVGTYLLSVISTSRR